MARYCVPRMWVVLWIVCGREIVQFFLFFPAYSKPQSSKRYYCDQREKEQEKMLRIRNCLPYIFTEDETTERKMLGFLCV